MLDLLMRNQALLWSIVVFCFHTLLTTFILLRLIVSRRSVAATLSWIVVVVMFPLLGPAFYLLIGELRLGYRRTRLIQQLIEPTLQRYRALDRPELRVDWGSMREGEMLARAGLRLMRVPALAGNSYRLVDDWQAVFDQLIIDIDSAHLNCDMEFYIWHDGGRCQEVVDALLRAVDRGVICRLLLDDIGSRTFLRSRKAESLRQRGIHILAALPGGIWRLPFVRFDLRMHRKIVLIDDEVAWTGSLNMVDPRHFKQNLGVGYWVDAMARLEGPSVEALAITFQSDWFIESNSHETTLPDVTGDQPIRQNGSSAIQVMPSGPTNESEAIERILITSIYMARQELIITTPYFVPSDALQMALTSAASRGVRVIVIIPDRLDSLLVRLASQAYMDDLLHSGVLIARFHGGLLHTKSVTIDDRLSLFGSLNMDPRSLRLNFEVTLTVYDEAFTRDLRALQQRYLDQSEFIDFAKWETRSPWTKFVERVARLIGPLL